MHNKTYVNYSRHLWMWDFKSLQYELSQIGFAEIRQCQFGDAEDPLFQEVEHPLQFVNAVGVECRKPSSSANLRTGN